MNLLKRWALTLARALRDLSGGITLTICIDIFHAYRLSELAMLSIVTIAASHYVWTEPFPKFLKRLLPKKSDAILTQEASLYRSAVEFVVAFGATIFTPDRLLGNIAIACLLNTMLWFFANLRIYGKLESDEDNPLPSPA